MGQKIDKIRAYNQILLAVAGTIGVLFLLGAAIFALQDLFWSPSYDSGIINSEEIEEAQEKGIRKEVISFSDLKVIDSANQLLLLTVSQDRLDKDEPLDKDFGLMNSFSGKYNDYGSSVFNNLVLYDLKTRQSTILFDHRIGIGEYSIQNVNSRLYITCTGSVEDSNKDKLINRDDLQKLFIYDIGSQQLSEIALPKNSNILNIYEPRYIDRLVVRLAIDRNQNGEVQNEPRVYMLVNLSEMKLEPFISDAEIEQLQNTLQGQ